jgi:hypothetical protein
MTTTRIAGALVAVAVALTACGDDGGGEGQDAASAPTGSSSSSSPPTTSGSATTAPPADGDGSTAGAPPFPANTAPDTGQASPDAFVTVTDVRTGHHEEFDRVVFEVAGTGTPGWDVRYVDSATSQGSGHEVPVHGHAILQATITGVGYPTETGIEEYDGHPLPGHDDGVVTEVVWDTTFEGTTVAFIGTSGQNPFRVYLLEDPARVVVDVVHTH